MRQNVLPKFVRHDHLRLGLAGPSQQGCHSHPDGADQLHQRCNTHHYGKHHLTFSELPLDMLVDVFHVRVARLKELAQVFLCCSHETLVARARPAAQGRKTAPAGPHSRTEADRVQQHVFSSVNYAQFTPSRLDSRVPRPIPCDVQPLSEECQPLQYGSCTIQHPLAEIKHGDKQPYFALMCPGVHFYPLPWLESICENKATKSSGWTRCL